MARTGCLLALDGKRRDGLEGNDVADRAAGLGADQHVADGCSGLKARGDVHGIADDIVTVVRHNHFARVDPDPQTDFDSEITLELEQNLAKSLASPSLLAPPATGRPRAAEGCRTRPSCRRR